MTPSRFFKTPVNVALGLAGVLLCGQLLPFAVVGERWGLPWICLTAPFSVFAESVIGFSSHPYPLILATSVVCSATWALIAYVLARRIWR